MTKVFEGTAEVVASNGEAYFLRTAEITIETNSHGDVACKEGNTVTIAYYDEDTGRITEITRSLSAPIAPFSSLEARKLIQAKLGKPLEPKRLVLR